MLTVIIMLLNLTWFVFKWSVGISALSGLLMVSFKIIKYVIINESF